MRYRKYQTSILTISFIRDLFWKVLLDIDRNIDNDQ